VTDTLDSLHAAGCVDSSRARRGAREGSNVYVGVYTSGRLAGQIKVVARGRLIVATATCATNKQSGVIHAKSTHTLNTQTSDILPTNEICRRTSSEKRPRDLVTHESVLRRPF